MTSIPQPRQSEHRDGLTHPFWCVPSLCERQLVDVVHRGVGELFVPTAEPAARELHLEVQRVRRDEARPGKAQVVCSEEIEVCRADGSGGVIAVLAVGDVPSLCGLLTAHACWAS